ncbi:MAG TPA: hypothetical protein VLT33_51330, partial [Labilithrix sp.]|nr:hypothetical protein [Labilithrix sp.]
SARFLMEAAERTAKLLPGSRTVRVPGGDHVMNILQPDLLAAAIRDLLSPSGAAAERSEKSAKARRGRPLPPTGTLAVSPEMLTHFCR